MNLNKNIYTLNNELDKFISLLNKTLPRYSWLMKKKSLTKEELNELGEIEYHLIDINAKINDVKKKLQHDLFGLSIDTYYRLKMKANNGDKNAQEKVKRMREAFKKSFDNSNFFYWN